MELRLNRFKTGDKSTLGKWFVNGNGFCDTLERAVKPVGFPDGYKPCIPVGTYNVIIDYSNHFGKNMPHIMDVPGYDGIRIHCGDTDADTEGCVLVADNIVNEDFVNQSQAAFGRFFPLLQMALNNGETVSLLIHEDFGS
jgi:hypothetical protein